MSCLSWAQCVQSLTSRAPSGHLNFGLPWFLLHWVWLWIELYVVDFWRFWSCDQRSAICLSSWHLLHSGRQTLYRARGCTSSCRHHFRFSGRISFVESFFQIQLVLLPFGQHPRVIPVEQDWADQGLNGEFCLAWNRRCLRSPKKHRLFAVWILRCISRLTSLVGVIRDPKYTHSLTTSKCLSPIATLCPTSRIVLSFPAAIIYISSFVHLFLIPLWLLLLPMLSKHSERLTDSYLRYLYHRHMRAVVFRCCRFVGLLVVRYNFQHDIEKQRIDNTSPLS
jgi:hypothetical protein